MRTIFQWLRWVCLLLLGLAWTTTSSFAAVGALNQANGGLTIRYDALETQNRGYDAEPLRAWDNNPPVMVDAGAFFGSPVQFNAAKGGASLYDDITRAGSRVANRATDVTKSQFEKNLIDSGFTRSLSKDGKAIILEKNGVKYILRDGAKSTGGPTADFYKPGSSAADLKIRLE